MRIWRFLCSLKLAIVLACAATLLLMGGSILFPFYPRLFGSMDQVPLAEWWRLAGAPRPLLTWWLPAAGLLLALLGVNTACCFFDWLLHLRLRWRKTGEYLVHLGFVLALTGYLWGSLAGVRSEGVRIPVGQTAAVPGLPGHYLRMEAFEPIFLEGRPVDLRADLSLMHGDTVLRRTVARTNHPLLYRDLVAFPLSYGREIIGPPETPTFRPVVLVGINRDPGAPVAAAGAAAILAGVFFALFSFYFKRARGDRPEIS